MNSNSNNNDNGHDIGNGGHDNIDSGEDDRKMPAKIDIGSDRKMSANSGVDSGMTIATVTPAEKYCNILDYFNDSSDDDVKEDANEGFKTAAKMLEAAMPAKNSKDNERKIINPYTVNKKPRLMVETADVCEITQEKMLKLIQLFVTKPNDCMVCKVCNVSDSGKECSNKKDHPGIATRAENFRKSVYDKTKRPFIQNVACFSRGCFVPIGICPSPMQRTGGYRWVSEKNCKYPDIIMDVVYMSKEVYGQDVNSYLMKTVGIDDTAMLTKTYKSNGKNYLLLHRVFVEIVENFICKV
jgi:hypothetical protein